MSEQTERFLIQLSICLIFAVLRLDGERSVVFQAFAHIWVGILLGTSYFTRSKSTVFNLVWLTLVETYAFFGKSLNL